MDRGLLFFKNPISNRVTPAKLWCKNDIINSVFDLIYGMINTE